MVQAISPDDIAVAKAFPDFVLEEWNKLIAVKFTAGSARITQEEAMQALLPHTQAGNRREVFDSGWLDIEEIYREQGWKVTFDKPGYNEDYDANFTFKAKG